MKVMFTKHADKKFGDLKSLGLSITKSQINNILSNPENTDRSSDHPNIISSGKLDKEHILRVVYRAEGDKILVITFYPAKPGRYYY